MAFWFVFACMLQYSGTARTEGGPFEKNIFPLGSDVSLSCEAESSTPQWERDGAPTANTTLLYNNTAFLLLHNVDQHSQGEYVCQSKNQRVQEYVSISQSTYKGTHILYRAADLNISEVSLICKSKYVYYSATWIFRSSQENMSLTVRAEKGKNASFQNMRFSMPVYDGNSFPLHVKPIMFVDSGYYGCYVKDDTVVFTTIWLRTIRVSAVPPGGVIMNQSVVLTCELSDVAELVTLAWLIMEGSRGVLVKQKVLTKGENKTLSVTVDSVSEEQLLWQCAVFTENKLRALVPITLHLLSEEGSRLWNVVAMVSAGVLGVGILAAALFFYQRRSTTAENQDIIYSAVSASGPQNDPSSRSKKGPIPSTSSDTKIIYSTIKIS